MTYAAKKVVAWDASDGKDQRESTNSKSVKLKESSITHQMEPHLDRLTVRTIDVFAIKSISQTPPL